MSEQSVKDSAHSSGVQQIQEAFCALSSDNRGQAKKIITELKPYEKEVFLETFQEKMKELSRSVIEEDVLLGFLGGFSSGKSSLINMMLAYPLLPVAKVTTSICPVEIRYGEAFKLQVFTYQKVETEGKQEVQWKENTIYTYPSNTSLDEEQIKMLKEYASLCVSSNVLRSENLDYYYGRNTVKTSAGQFGLNLDDPYQVGQLLLLPLCGFVGQGEDEDLSDTTKKVLAQWHKIMSEVFGIKDQNNEDYGVRLWVNSEILREGVSLVDLPGLNSNVAAHTELTLSYLRRVDCCIIVFGADGSYEQSKQALNAMADFEMMKTPGKSERFLAVINKCDMLDDPDDIAQAVNQIKPHIKAVKLEQMIAVSAYYAEIRMVDNGFQPQNTMMWSKRNIKNRLSEEEFLEELREDYASEFIYEDPVSHVEYSNSTKRFIEERVGQHAVRVRMLKAMQRTRETARQCGLALGSLEVQAAMIRMLQVCGDDLMKDLLKKMKKALDDTTNNFNLSQSQYRRELSTQVQHMGANMKKVYEAYNTGMDDADRALNGKIDNHLSKMDSDMFDHVILDELDDRSKANKKEYDKLISYINNFKLDSFLQAGNNLLKSQLDDQRQCYATSIQDFINHFQDMVVECEEALQKAYRAFKNNPEVQKAPEDVRKVYEGCFQQAKNAIVAQVQRIAQQMQDEMSADTRLEEQISDTLSKMQSLYNENNKSYREICKSYLKTMQRTSFWRDRPILMVAEIKAAQKRFAGSQEKEKFREKLQKLLIDPEDSHLVRMMNTVPKVYQDFCNRSRQKCNAFFPIVEASVSNLFGVARPKIVATYLQLKGIAEPMLLALEALQSAEGMTLAFHLVEERVGGNWAKLDYDETISMLHDNVEHFRSFMEKIDEAAEKAV